ncbi:hypothetical protein LTR10_008035 [Elasticomyces elasticus]|nr:hypothetical protein LTR10_008035 [Elasticomyces elasticus]KAK4971032.1 hypothetical protein LTR42_008011 [Elasticomyces elasticus]
MSLNNNITVYTGVNLTISGQPTTAHTSNEHDTNNSSESIRGSDSVAIIFGTLGVVLAFAAILVGIYYGRQQLRKLSKGWQNLDDPQVPWTPQRPRDSLSESTSHRCQLCHNFWTCHLHHVSTIQNRAPNSCSHERTYNTLNDPVHELV